MLIHPILLRCSSFAYFRYARSSRLAGWASQHPSKQVILQSRLKGKLFIISGPSGVGKGTVIKALKKEFPQFVYPISQTTRQKRPQEKDGEVYDFISERRFQQGIQNGEFLEWAKVHEANYYGTLKKPIVEALSKGQVMIREVDVQGFHSIRKVIPADNLITIFLKAESLEKLMERIKKRGRLPDEEVKRRMASAKKELKDAKLFDYQVWSLENKIEQCYQEVKKIILNEIDQAGLKI
jgi:guanylate kinase